MFYTASKMSPEIPLFPNDSITLSHSDPERPLHEAKPKLGNSYVRRESLSEEEKQAKLEIEWEDRYRAIKDGSVAIAHTTQVEAVQE
jgi:hypothetical protein